MNFDYSKESLALQDKLTSFMDRNIYPHEKKYDAFVEHNRWQQYPHLDRLKQKAKARRANQRNQGEEKILPQAVKSPSIIWQPELPKHTPLPETMAHPSAT